MQVIAGNTTAGQSSHRKQFNSDKAEITMLARPSCQLEKKETFMFTNEEI